MITQKDLVEILLQIYNRDNRIKDTIEIYDKFVDIIKSPYSGDTQYPIFIEFLKEFKEGVDSEAIVNTFTKNPGFINIIRNIGRSTEESALRIANLKCIIETQSSEIETDFRYLAMYRDLYTKCILSAMDENEKITVEETTSYAAFILSAFECNPYMTPESYRSLVNALYEALFEFLFMGEDGVYIVPNHPFLKTASKQYFAKKTFRFDEFINHTPIVTKFTYSTCSDEIKNIRTKSLNALDYISDFYWMVEKFDRGFFDNIKNLFDKSEPI